ncbi:MAG: hypothetical protein ACOCUI_04425 [bacterium]
MSTSRLTMGLSKNYLQEEFSLRYIKGKINVNWRIFNPDTGVIHKSILYSLKGFNYNEYNKKLSYQLFSMDKKDGIVPEGVVY